VVTSRVRRALADRAATSPNIVFWADSRRRICQFRNVTIKANQFELLGRQHPRPGETVELDTLHAALPEFRSRVAAPVFVTLGPDGMLVSDPAPTVVPGLHVDGPIDETGAGDSATAGAVLALAGGASWPEAALIGNLVASITIQQLATTGTARRDELAPRLAAWNQQHGPD
jgi:sugar/nucleoside kinase (ribokinase family)